MLEAKTPIGRIQIPSWVENKLINLSNEELLQRAIKENKDFCISPATYAMIEKRSLEMTLQKLINQNVGMSHDTLRMIIEW